MKIANIAGVCLLALTSWVSAAPSSMVAWDVETLKLVKQGDPEVGGALAEAYTCNSCHGEGGVAPTPNWPSLAGQLPTYLYKQLRDYKDGKRENPLMKVFASAMTDQNMADVAAYYASQPLPNSEVTPSGDEKATQLIKIGDGSRLISACQNCHGRNGTGNATTSINVATMPALVGQFPAYLVRTMQAYKSGERANDVYARMRSIASAMSDEEIQAVADYYGTLAQ